jgi:hypothetical protein
MGSNLSRREFIVGGALAAGLTLTPRLEAIIGTPKSDDLLEQAKKIKPKAKAVIQVFLWGGMSHNDTWDPKPDSGREYMNDIGAIPTTVDGMMLSQWFPMLAKQAERFSLIRSMTHRNDGHETAAYLMQTGHNPGEKLAYPSMGAVFAFFKTGYKGLIPPYVVLTQPQGRFSEEGFLGSKYKPFATGGDPNAARWLVEGVVSPGITNERQKARREFKDKVNTMANSMKTNAQIQAAYEAEKIAYQLILGQGKEVFNLSHEKPELRDRYGRHTFGQSCLAARRLVEAEVPYVVINSTVGWDTHSNHFRDMPAKTRDLDQGLAMLLQDLYDRGRLQDTLVWCCGEFGRKPKIDWEPPWNGGRNHWGKVFSVLVAGGGFKGGQVYGSSDAKGEEPLINPVYPVDFLGTIYALGGIGINAKLPHPLGFDARVLPIRDDGKLEEGVRGGRLLTNLL